MAKTFTTKLVTFSHGTLTRIAVPADVAKSFASPGRVALQGTINGFPFRASLARLHDGKHYIAVNAEMRKGAKAKPGDTVKVTLERINRLQHFEVPADFQRALARNAKARAVFDKLTPSHQLEYVVYVSRVTSPETRKRRLEQMIETLLSANKKSK
jgi:hypothetical protein